MRVAFVVPRYGVEVVGGAELGARMLAERLVSQCGWDVEVLTTCALDARTWADAYEPGSVEVNGVAVHRFASAAGRDPGFDRFSRRALANPPATSTGDQVQWVAMQGPRTPDLVGAVRATEAAAVVFYPYLYYPTVYGLPPVARRAVLHPAAHDEPPLRLPLYREVFGAARGLVFQTDGERRLVQAQFPVAATRSVVLGLGIEEHVGDPQAVRDAFGLGDRPYLLYVGRVDDGKGTSMLVRFFAAYKERHPGPLALVLASKVVDRPPPTPDVHVVGVVDEDVKWGLYRGAELFVHPSAYEAFSLVLIEAWTAGLPALVNARCFATREHCERSGGGLWFEGYAAFEATLDRLLGDEALRAGLGAAGAAYVDSHFRWPALIDRYARFLTEVVRSA